MIELIGNTPMVKINKITKAEGVKCEIVAKLEFCNPGGSTKDRIAKTMIEYGERDGSITKGTTLIEATSGNTGIGVAWVGGVKGYPVAITIPERMSIEKCDTIKALGAQIIRTPTEAKMDTNESYVGIATNMNKQLENSVFFNQVRLRFIYLVFTPWK